MNRPTPPFEQTNSPLIIRPPNLLRPAPNLLRPAPEDILLLLHLRLPEPLPRAERYSSCVRSDSLDELSLIVQGTLSLVDDPTDECEWFGVTQEEMLDSRPGAD